MEYVFLKRLLHHSQVQTFPSRPGVKQGALCSVLTWGVRSRRLAACSAAGVLRGFARREPATCLAARVISLDLRLLARKTL